MRIMSLDVGSQTIGVAVSDLFGWTAQYDLDEMAADGWNFTKNNPNGL